MKVLAPLVVLVAAAAALAVGVDAATHEGAIKQVLAVQDKISATLASITNQETADAAKPELQKSAKEFVTLRAQIEKLPPPSREEKDRLEKEYKGKLEAAQKKLSGEVIRVQNIPGGQAALKEIRSVLEKRMK